MNALLIRLSPLLTVFITLAAFLTFPVAVVVLVLLDMAQLWPYVPAGAIVALLCFGLAALIALNTMMVYRHPERRHDPLPYSVAFDRGWHAACLFLAIGVAILVHIPAVAVFLPARFISTFLRSVPPLPAPEAAESR